MENIRRFKIFGCFFIYTIFVQRDLRYILSRKFPYLLQIMKRLIDLFRNKYFLATVAFAMWMLFFDKNDMMSQYEYRSQANKLQEEKEYFEKETAQVKKDLNELNTNLNTAEKFAREKYFMKKDNEDVFVIIHEEKKD